MTFRRLPKPANDNFMRGVFNYFGDPRGNLGAQFSVGAALCLGFFTALMGLAHELGKLAH